MASIKKDNIGLVSGFIYLNLNRQKQPIKYAFYDLLLPQKKFGLLKRMQFFLRSKHCINNYEQISSLLIRKYNNSNLVQIFLNVLKVVLSV